MMQGLLCAEGQLEKNIMAADATGEFSRWAELCY